jgi:outer membrane protein assembly factor BamE
MRTSVFSRSPALAAASPSSSSTRSALRWLAVAGVAFVAGCGTIEESPMLRRTVHFFEPYRADVIQGNVVTSEQIDRVKPGMTRVQVRDILGSPLIADPFHADRWDYVFTMQRQGIPPVRRGFTVRFEKDAVTKIEAPGLPTETQFVADISVTALPTSSPKLELSDEEKATLPEPKRTAAPAAAAAASAGTGPQRTYPPLEPQ